MKRMLGWLLVTVLLMGMATALPCAAWAEAGAEPGTDEAFFMKLPAGLTWNVTPAKARKALGDRFLEEGDGVIAYRLGSDSPFENGRSVGFMYFNGNQLLMIAWSLYETDNAFYTDLCERLKDYAEGDPPLDSLTAMYFAKTFVSTSDQAEPYHIEDKVVLCVHTPGKQEYTSLIMMPYSLLFE